MVNEFICLTKDKCIRPLVNDRLMWFETLSVLKINLEKKRTNN